MRLHKVFTKSTMLACLLAFGTVNARVKRMLCMQYSQGTRNILRQDGYNLDPYAHARGDGTKLESIEVMSRALSQENDASIATGFMSITTLNTNHMTPGERGSCEVTAIGLGFCAEFANLLALSIGPRASLKVVESGTQVGPEIAVGAFGNATIAIPFTSEWRLVASWTFYIDDLSKLKNNDLYHEEYNGVTFSVSSAPKPVYASKLSLGFGYAC